MVIEKAKLKQGLVVGIAIFALVVAAPVATFALRGSDDTQTQTEANRGSDHQIAEQSTQSDDQSVEVEHEEQTEDRLKTNAMSDDNLEHRKQRQEKHQQREKKAFNIKACQNREKAVQNIMERIADRGTRQLEVFTTISERVQAFYTEKGNTLDNYSDLVTEVNAKKTAADATVENVKNTSTTFSCEDNPRGVAQTFKQSLKDMRAALKEYKTAIKNLIVGVKSVQSTTTDDNTKGDNAS